MLLAYLQHGKPPGPFRTERVPHRFKPIPYYAYHRRQRALTNHMVQWGGRWHRVVRNLPGCYDASLTYARIAGEDVRVIFMAS